MLSVDFNCYLLRMGAFMVAIIFGEGGEGREGDDGG